MNGYDTKRNIAKGWFILFVCLTFVMDKKLYKV